MKIKLPYHTILGSQSPRRKQLLSEIITDFKVVTKDTDESISEYKNSIDFVEQVSLKKSRAFTLEENQLLITADTVVVLEDEILGKPKDENDALQMLKKMAGKTHQVHSGVTVRTFASTEVFSDTTHVTFYPLSDEELKAYITACKPLDKAGSYGIQEWMGYVGIKEMRGEFYNVMGLPLHKLYRTLKLRFSS